MANDQGQLWSAVAQIGKETTAGTAVAATRKVYWRDPSLTINRDPRVHRFATGTRDNVRGYTNGPVQAAGSFALAMSADEIVEPLLIAVQGGVTPTTPAGATNARLWTFKPAGALDSITVEWADGARTWQGAGVRGDALTISGAANEANDVSVDLFGTDVVAGSLTGALAERTPTFMEGWQTRLYVDPFASTPGTTPIPGLLRNWNVMFKNGLGRVYTADNTLGANRITSGELDVTATLTFDAYPSAALSEFNNWVAAVQRMVRLEFLGPADEIEAGANEVQTITVSGTPTGGTFITRVLGQDVSLAYNSSSGAAQTAINAALAVLGTGHTVTVTGGALPGAALTVTFSGAQVSARDIPLMTLTTNSLTGGTTPTAAYATTTPGRSGRRSVMVDLPGAWTTVNLGGSADGHVGFELASVIGGAGDDTLTATTFTGSATLDLPAGAVCLSVREQGDRVCLWALVDPKGKPERRQFFVATTGNHAVPPDSKYLGTAMLDWGRYVVHVFEIWSGVLSLLLRFSSGWHLC
mgnify:CR=1 FL=1